MFSTIMDYSAEPPYSTLLDVRDLQPINAEPTAASLVEFNITPENLVYCRNHGPVREFDEESYNLVVKGTGEGDISLSVKDLKSTFPCAQVLATLQCAGIRRKEMGSIKPVHGVPWTDGIVANCRWGGVRLSDLLTHLGVIPQADLHVCFESHATGCQDDNCYGASIPLARALNPAEDVLLAYEMNGDPLSPHHGAPLRVVVPGYLGARWVKWVDTIIISSDESPNFYQQRDYKVLPPNVESTEQANRVWSQYPSMTALPLNSVIARIDRISDRTLYVKGYALAGPSGNVKAVELTVDEGKSWYPARIRYQEGKWCWIIWDAELECSAENGTVYSRAIDTGNNVQPKDGVWNLRGLAYNAWGRAHYCLT